MPITDVELKQKVQDILGSHADAQNPANWPQRSRTLFEAKEAEAKFNTDMLEALHTKLGIPRNIRLSDKQVDEIAKTLKLSDESSGTLKTLAKEGPIQNNLLDVIAIDKPDLANFPFDKLPEANQMSYQDAKDLIKVVASDNPWEAIDKTSPRSAIGHILRRAKKVEGNYGPREKGIVEKIRQQYGFDPESMKRQDNLEKIQPLFQRLFPVTRAEPGLVKHSFSNLGRLRDMADIDFDKGTITPNQISKVFPQIEKNTFFDRYHPRANISDITSPEAQAIPLIKKESEALNALRAKGYDPSDPSFYLKEGKQYTPKELSDILEKGSSKKGIEGDIEFVTALEQARAAHEQRTGERVPVPTVTENIRENPYVYQGAYRADTPEEIKKSWEKGQELQTGMEANRVLESQRMNDFINAMKSDPALADEISPQLDAMREIPSQLEGLRSKYFGADMVNHPAYQESVNRYQHAYDEAARKIDRETAEEVIPALRGRYAKLGHNWNASPSYRDALDKAARVRNERKEELRLKYLNQGNMEGMQRLMAMAPQESSNLTSQFDISKANAMNVQDLWKGARERRAQEMIDLPQKAYQQDLKNLASQQEVLGNLGTAKQSDEQAKLDAARAQAKAKSPMAELETAAYISDKVAGQPALPPPHSQNMQPFPQQQYVPTPTSGAAAILPSFFASMGMGPSQQQQPAINLMVGAPPMRHAEGGVVGAPEYNALMQQQLGAIENYVRQKQRHNNLPVMAVNPFQATMGSVATNIGKSMGPRSMLGGWAQGMGSYPEHQQAHLNRELSQVTKDAELEKILAELRGDATKQQGTREHNLSDEDIRNRTLAEQIRHNQASEGEMATYHKLLADEKKEERERKRKELTPQKMKLIDEHQRVATGASKIMAEAAFLSSVAPYLNTGGNSAKHLSPYNLGLISAGNTADSMDFFNNRNEILVKSINDLAGKSERTKAALDLSIRSKIGVNNVPETNVANGKTQVMGGSSILADSTESQLRDGMTLHETIDSLEEKYNNELDFLKKTYESFFATGNYSEAEQEAMLANGIAELNEGYGKVAARLMKKKKKDK